MEVAIAEEKVSTYLKSLICASCLSNDRTLFFISQTEPILKILPVTLDLSTDRICWECNMLLRKINIFIDNTVKAQKYLTECMKSGGELRTLSTLATSYVIQDYVSESDRESADNDELNDITIEKMHIDGAVNNKEEKNPLKFIKRVYPVRVFTKPEKSSFSQPQAQPHPEDMEGVSKIKISNVSSLSTCDNQKIQSEEIPKSKTPLKSDTKSNLTRNMNPTIKPRIKVLNVDEIKKKFSGSTKKYAPKKKESVKFLNIKALDADGNIKSGYLKKGDCIKLSKTASDALVKRTSKGKMYKIEKVPPKHIEKRIKFLRKVKFDREQWISSFMKHGEQPNHAPLKSVLEVKREPICETEQICETQTSFETDQIQETDPASDMNYICKTETICQGEQTCETEPITEADRIYDTEPTCEPNQISKTDQSSGNVTTSEKALTSVSEPSCKTELVCEADLTCDIKQLCETKSVYETKAICEKQANTNAAELALSENVHDTKLYVQVEMESVNVNGSPLEVHRPKIINSIQNEKVSSEKFDNEDKYKARSNRKRPIRYPVETKVQNIDKECHLCINGKSKTKLAICNIKHSAKQKQSIPEDSERLCSTRMKTRSSKSVVKKYYNKRKSC